MSFTSAPRTIPSVGCIEIARTFDAPFTATSANKSGVAPSRSFDETIERLADRADLIDLAIDAGELVPSLPSTVVDISSGNVVILREGAISAEKVRSEAA